MLQLTKNNVNSIQYSFNDASVPPKFHRSYRVVITPETLHIIVKSYQTVLSDNTFQISEKEFANLVYLINEANLVSCTQQIDNCVGGKSEELVIVENKKRVYRSFIDHCGGKGIPTKCGDFLRVKTAIKQLIPNSVKR